MNPKPERAIGELDQVEARPIGPGEREGDAVAVPPRGEVACVQPAAKCQGVERAQRAIAARGCQVRR